MILAELSPDGSRIFLTSDRRLAGLGGIVAGSRFSTVGGPHWSVPLTMDACRSLRAEFGKELRVGSRLSEWARGAIALEHEMSSLGEADDAFLERVPSISPVLAKAMANRPYQRAGARFVARAREVGGVLIADEPGLGKTLEAIGGVIESGVPGPYLVVAPKTSIGSVWSREIPRWWPGQTVVTVPDGRVKRDAILNTLARMDSDFGRPEWPANVSDTWIVVHPEMLRCNSYWLCGFERSDAELRTMRELSLAEGYDAEPERVCGVRTKWNAGPKTLECDHAGVFGEVVNDYLFPQLFSVDWGAVIVDESDRALLRPTGTPNLVRRGMELIPTRPGGLRVAMSGTPFRGRPRLLWGTLNWLRPKQYPGFWRWCETHYEVTQGGYGGSRTIGELRPEKAAALDFELRQIMLRRTKAEVAPDLPAKTYGGTPLDATDEFSPVGVWLDMDPVQARLYAKMQAESAVALEGGDLSAIGILAEMTRMKQFATSTGRMNGTEFVPTLPSNKFNWLVEYLEELGYPYDPQAKVIVVSQFTNVLSLFEREINKLYAKSIPWKRFGTSRLTGEVSGSRRTGVIDRFNGEVGSPTEHLLFLQIKTGGVAITLDTADQMVFLDETWVPDDHIQAEDRIHRVSRPRPVTYWYLRSVGTIEEGIAQVNAERREVSHSVLDGRRGMMYLRQILRATKGES